MRRIVFFLSVYNKYRFNKICYTHDFLSSFLINDVKRPVWEQQTKKNLKTVENTNVIWQVMRLVDLWASKNLRPDNKL